ncbi:MAG TPA: hypothetical protein VLI91_08170, partial [Roseiarcus sp.]|nr:hypothetical protein [Roseiarcus sp.]
MAGLAAAAAMEALSFAGAKVGFQTIDFVREMSLVAFDGSRVAASLAAGAGHLGVGVCWAVFYASFFWGRLRLRPP